MKRAIMDFHVHCFPDRLAEKALRSVRLGDHHQTTGRYSDLRKWMEHYGVRKCLILNMASRPDTMENVNTFAISVHREDTPAFGSVHPLARDAFTQLERIAQAGLPGVKFHTGYQCFAFDDPRCFPVYRRIGELGLATLVHCGLSQKSSKNQVWPSTVSKVIDCFQGAPFICAHMGGVSAGHPDFHILESMPVYVDSALADRWMTPDEFGEAVARLGAHRVLFGSDLPWGSYQRSLELVENAPLSDAQKNQIFFENGEALLSCFAKSNCGITDTLSRTGTDASKK